MIDRCHDPTDRPSRAWRLPTSWRMAALMRSGLIRLQRLDIDATFQSVALIGIGWVVKDVDLPISQPSNLVEHARTATVVEP